ncbi:MAG TPA: HAMP domain-containing sensor histidine kinase [Vicinamibacterales bacterium]|nr:HAMP domain-containing sensor histidine kinase [Vicinamibacterales bacterium]
MPGPRRSRSTFIVILLVATLALTAGLAYEAQQAVRSHRATAENVLRDYSTFAAWELTRLGRQQLLDVMNHGLAAVRTAHRSGNLSAAVGTTANCPSGCGGTRRIASAFHATLPEAQFSFAGAAVDPSVKAVLIEAVKEGLRNPDEFTCPTLRMVPVNGSPTALVWAPSFDRSNRPTGLIGFVSDAAFVTQVFEKLVRHSPLLPPSLVPAGADPNAALAVRVSTPEDQELFASAAESSSYQARTNLPPAFGSLRLVVAPTAAAAGTLVIGGLPRERLPLVVGLLALTVGLVVVAVVQLRREAEISRLRSDFVSGVSHELRTPLAQIRMFTETLLLGRVRNEHEGRRSLEIIAREAQRLAQLVENVLLFSRGERQAPAISRESARLAPIIADVAESFAPLAAARQTRLTMVVDETVNGSVDGGALRQILLNLLDNAVKYGPAGQNVTVTLRLVDDTMRLSVEDEGPGVDPRDSDRIWQPFNRLAHPGNATGGTGIGLAIVRQLTDLHGGRAWVEPAARGARFVVEIPGAWRESGASTAVA